MERQGGRPGRATMARAETAPKIQDIATRAGVSIMTVSRAMRGVEGVSSAKRAEILRLAKALGYRPNRNASSLATAHSTLIGVSLPTLFDDVFGDILAGIRHTFDLTGFDMVIDVSGYSIEREEAWVERMLDWQPAGVVLSGVEHSQAVRLKLREAGIPTLEIWDVTETPIDLNVGIDHQEAGRLLGAHLAGLGYRRPAIVGVEAGVDQRAEKRFCGLNAAFEAAGLAPARIERVRGHLSFEAGMHGTLPLLAEGTERPDVICFLNDHMAFAGLATCGKLGLRVPEEIGIAGFNGMAINSVLERPLTTVITPRRQMGMAGARALLARIKGAKIDRRTCLPVTLFPGETTRRQDC